MVALPARTSSGNNGGNRGCRLSKKHLTWENTPQLQTPMETRMLTKLLHKKIMPKDKCFPPSSSAMFLNVEAEMTSRPTCI